MTAIQHALDHLRTISGETWIAAILLACLIAVAAMQVVVWLTAYRVCRNWPKWIARFEAIRLRVEQTSSLFAAGGRRLCSSARTYQLAEQVGAGDLCDIHRAFSSDREHVVKLPRSAAAERLIANEFAIVEHLQKASRDSVYREYLPAPVELNWSEERRIAVYQWRQGYYDGEAILRRHPQGLDGRHIAWMFNRTLEILGFVHRAGWVHGAVLPPHLLMHAENHGLQLIGFVHAQRMSAPLHVVPVRFKAWYPPECHCREGATAASDIYLAARSMIALAGGDPLTGAMPRHVPVEIQRLLKECTWDDPALRPSDAWELRGRFDILLSEVYGRPKFCHLVMS